MTPLGRYVLETVVTLFLVAGLAVAVLYAVRRLGVGRPTGPLELAGRLALDARKAVYLVRIGETVYVLGASEAGLTKLGELPRSTLERGLPALAVEPTSAFRDLLERARSRPEGLEKPPGSGAEEPDTAPSPPNQRA
jgi:flagellar biogenesis protein FliO